MPRTPEEVAREIHGCDCDVAPACIEARAELAKILRAYASEVRAAALEEAVKRAERIEGEYVADGEEEWATAAGYIVDELQRLRDRARKGDP